MAEHELFLYAFFLFFALEFLVERGLSWLNARHVASFRGKMPEQLHGLVTPETFEKSIDYTLARARFGHVSAVWNALLTLGVLLSGMLALFASVGPMIRDHGVLENFLDQRGSGVVAFALFFLFIGALRFPLELYATFVLEQRFGFNKTTLGTFLLDRVKGLFIAALLGLPFLWVIFWLVTDAGPWWWLYAALFTILFQLVMMVIGPLLIAPLFYKFTPLPDGELRTALEALSKQCAFAVGGLFVMDGSRRSAHSNAFFTGLGKARRIVLFDTLIAQLSVPELAAVLAHEIGHYKRRHIPKTLILSCLMTVAGFWVLGRLLEWEPYYQAFGVGLSSPAKGLLIFALISGSFTFWVTPFFNALSRKHEFEADAYAKEKTAAEPMAGALLKLFQKNLGNFVPHPWFSAWNYSHPTLLERLRALGVKKPTASA
jgi:STE24 endopeptidase